MTLTSKVAQAARKRTKRSMPRVLVVKDVWHLTPNMIRVVFAGPELMVSRAGATVEIAS